MKIIILILFFLIVYFLISALYYLMRERANPKKAARAMMWRVGLSLALLVLLILGFYAGWIQPHALPIK